MSQITVRGIPKDVDRAIRRKAAEEGKSINRTINDLLQQALGLEPDSEKQRDLADLAGSWGEEEALEFENAVRAFETVDDEVWR